MSQTASSPAPLRVLFVCTGNAGRSQLAQAICTLAGGRSVLAESAGVAPWAQLHPMAVRLMEEKGVNLAAHRPKGIPAVADRAFDLVVTLGDPARERLPLRLKGNPLRMHWDIADPADADGTPESERVFRHTLGQIEKRMSRLVEEAPRFIRPGALHWQPGINSGLWITEDLDETHPAVAAAAGFKAMEVSPYLRAEHFNVRDAGQIRRVRRGADNAGIAIWSLHSRDVGDITSPYPAIRQTQIDELLWCLDAAEELGATAVVSHLQILGRHFDDLPSAEAHLADAMTRLASRAEASPVRFALENGYACKEGQWTRDMFRRVAPFSPAAFGYVLDTGHANVAGDLADIEAGIGERLISLHLNDNSGTDIHQTGGKGTVDWARIARLLKATRYDGCLMWEIGANRKDFNPQLLIDTMTGHRQLMEYLAEGHSCGGQGGLGS